ncbi:permease prefix domain 1-containing protein [Gracilibacillus alcaliphilus]|uniref:permease prefix domain 1-containing protein n=1 Tax=Gracilibacillus alcaliphilus TaxID=1401441 RepID=UPI0019578501|nr:cation transport ATPase [Gracilibacillus alcaliphilus]
MRKITNHVEELFKDIPDSEEKQTIQQEILQNLEEKVYDLMEHGKEEEDAINKAIVEFGHIDEIKNELGVRTPDENSWQKKKKEKTKIDLGFSICGSALIIGLMLFINMYYSPDTIWFVYPTFAVLWWPLAMFYRWLKWK